MEEEKNAEKEEKETLPAAEGKRIKAKVRQGLKAFFPDAEGQRIKQGQAEQDGILFEAGGQRIKQIEIALNS